MTPSDQHWFELIQQCRTSGLSDRQWCIQNGVSVSTFYYHIKALRKKACEIPAASNAIEQHQEIVPLDFANEPPTNIPVASSIPAVRMSLNGIQIDIMNQADESVILHTIRALQMLC